MKRTYPNTSPWPRGHKLRKWFQGLIETKKYSWLHKIFLAPLFALSLLYLLIGRCREMVYQYGLLGKSVLPCRAICVGNITVGGTGKTPTVELVCRTLLQKGIRVGIISRGYGRRTSTRSHLDTFVVSDGEKIFASAQVAGDEPVMLAKRLAHVPVLIGKNRYQAGLKACKKFKIQTVIMDDGFQHLQLARDLNIVVLDGQSPFGNGYGLPVGRLRESPRALKRADIILLTKITDNEQKNRVLQKIRKYNQTVPVVIGRHTPRDLVSIKRDKRISLEALRGKNIVALSGIGDPSYFLTTLMELGAKVTAHMAFPDHHWYSMDEIRPIEHKVSSGKSWGLVTTEKDAVRISQVPQCPVWILRIDMVLMEGERLWKKALG